MLKKSLSIFVAIAAIFTFTFIACKKCDDLPAPTVTVSNITSTSARATWNKIEGADSYEVVLANQSLASSSIVSTNEVSATEFAFNSITVKTGLVVKVTPRCKNGKLGTNTGTSTPFVASDPCNLAAPTLIDVSSLTATTAKLNWEPVPNANGYQIQVLDLTTNKLKTINVQGPPLTLDSLIAGRNYRITVAPKCSNGSVSSNRKSIDYEHFIIIDDIVVMFGKMADSLCIKDGVGVPLITLSAGQTYTKFFAFNVTDPSIPATGGCYHIRTNAGGTNEFKFVYGDFGGEVRIMPFKGQCTGQKYTAPKQDINFPDTFASPSGVIYTLFADRVEIYTPVANTMTIE
jgi:hypothetical protein